MKLHPSPQRARRGWYDLNGRWGFAYDDADVGVARGWHESAEPYRRTIVVPYPPESRLSGVGDDSKHPVVWYRRSFALRAVPYIGGAGRLLLHFGAVDYAATVWLNGSLVERHEGGHSSFSLDVTDALRDRDEQVLVVRAEDQPNDLSQPRGKQSWESEPAKIWYKRTTGIWQPVWLEAVGRTYIEELAWTPDVGRGTVTLEARLSAEVERPLRLRVRLSRGPRGLAHDIWAVRRREIVHDIRLPLDSSGAVDPDILWSPSRPHLVDADVVLEDEAGRTLDVVRSYVGVRTVAVRDERFLLNGQPVYLRLVLAQGYWPESHLAAPSEDALRREVELARALGFNGLRIHQKVEDQRFLYWCDRLGLLVWGEMANAYAFNADAVRRFTQEWQAVVRRDRSHPAIVTWVPFNESWGVPDLPADAAQRAFVRDVYRLTKTLDPTRPVIGNDGWEHVVGDILGLHDYATDGESLRRRYGTPAAVAESLSGRPNGRRAVLDGVAVDGRPIVLSEFGGSGYVPQPGRPWFGHGTVGSEKEYLRRYEELVGAVLDCESIAGFCYTQLADTEQETNGLLRADRTPKLDVDRVRAITARPARAVATVGG